MNSKKNCFSFGTVLKKHGYKGVLKIFVEKEFVNINLSDIKYLLIEKNEILVPYFIENISHFKKNIFLLKLEDINSEKELSYILNKKLFVSKDQVKIEKSIEEKVIGFKVIDEKLDFIGYVIEVSQQTTQKLLYVKKNDKIFCFPMHNNFVKKINKKSKIINVLVSEEIINLND